MTYFSVIPKSIKERKLKIAIVFLHTAFRFEAWLSGLNRQVQTQYWELFKDSGWNKYQSSIFSRIKMDDRRSFFADAKRSILMLKGF